LDFCSASLDDRGDVGGVLVTIGALSFEAAPKPEDIDDAGRLQAAIRRCFLAARVGAILPARDVATINSYASDELPALILRPDGSVARSAIDPVRAGLAAVARDAVETIATHARDLRTCANGDCGRLFLDRSRAKGRRWCSMRRCGNRVKVAAFRCRSR
jgi:predicted RNA-binding Zn ribbon-like protein